MLGGYFIEHANAVPANLTVTPMHIVPPWYFAPFYSVLRGIPNKLMGVALTTASLGFLFALPWLDRSKVKSIRYRGIWSKVALMVLVISFAVLGFLGTQTLTPLNLILSRIFMTFYFLFFLLMPFYTKYEKTKPVPTRVNYP